MFLIEKTFSNVLNLLYIALNVVPLCLPNMDLLRGHSHLYPDGSFIERQIQPHSYPVTHGDMGVAAGAGAHGPTVLQVVSTPLPMFNRGPLPPPPFADVAIRQFLGKLQTANGVGVLGIRRNLNVNVNSNFITPQ